MVQDTDNAESGSQRRSPLRFSLLSLFVLITLACLALGWFTYQKNVVATAQFRVRSSPPIVLGQNVASRLHVAEFEMMKRTQLALLKSYYVVEQAIREPAIASLPILRSQADPVKWLCDNLEVDFPVNGEILAIRLRGTKAHANDLIRLVDAVANAYQSEVIDQQKRERLDTRDLLARSLDKLNGEIKAKWQTYLDVAKETGGSESSDVAGAQASGQIELSRLERIEKELTGLQGDIGEAEGGSDSADRTAIVDRVAEIRKQIADLKNSVANAVAARGEKPVDLITRQDELKHLQEVAHEMAKSLERMDIELSAPSRIQQLHKAVISQ